MSYTSPKWKNGSAPALSAETLQLLTDAVEAHDQELPDKAGKPTEISVVLAQSGWDASTKEQTVAASGMTADADIIVSAAPASFIAYAQAGVRCTAQGAGILTFTCETVPGEALIANVIILG